MDSKKIFEPIGLLVAGASTLLSLIFFFSYSQMFLGSLFAAVMTGALVWSCYLIIRLVVLALK